MDSTCKLSRWLASILLQHQPQLVAELVDMAAFGKQGRCDDGGVAGGLDVQPCIEQPFLDLMSTCARLLGWREVDSGQHAITADIGDDRQIGKMEQLIEEIGRHLRAALEQPFALVDIERRQTGSARRRMRRERVAMEEL